MKNKPLTFQKILLESAILGLSVFFVYGLNLEALKRYPVFVIIGIPVLYLVQWIAIKLIKRFTNWKEQ